MHSKQVSTMRKLFQAWLSCRAMQDQKFGWKLSESAEVHILEAKNTCTLMNIEWQRIIRCRKNLNDQ